MSISVTARPEASSSRKDSSLLSLIFLLVSTAQSFPESSQHHRVRIAAFEPAAVSLTVPLTGSVVAVTQMCSDNVFVGRLQKAVP